MYVHDEGFSIPFSLFVKNCFIIYGEYFNKIQSWHLIKVPVMFMDILVPPSM